MKATPAGQLGLFDRKPVQHPGIRGGHYYITESGMIRYGEPPTGAHALEPGVELVQHRASLARLSDFRARPIRTPHDVADIFHDAADIDRERLWVLHMDRDLAPTAVELASIGTQSASLAHPRELLKNAVALGTPRIAFIHNHPSGLSRLSSDDVAITNQAKEWADQMGIDVLFHVVVGREGWSVFEPKADPHAQNIAMQYEWSPPATAPGAPLREVEGRMYQLAPGHRPSLSGPGAAAELGRKLLDPGDQMALLIAVDTKHAPVGIFPLAHSKGDLEPGMLKRALYLATRASASKVLVVAGEDDWAAQIMEFGRSLESALGPAIPLLDTVLVTKGGFVAASDAKA